MTFSPMYDRPNSMVFTLPLIPACVEPNKSSVETYLKEMYKHMLPAHLLVGSSVLSAPEDRPDVVHASMMAAVLDLTSKLPSVTDQAEAISKTRAMMFEVAYCACQSIFTGPDLDILVQLSGLPFYQDVATLIKYNLEGQKRSFDEGSNPVTSIKDFSLDAKGRELVCNVTTFAKNITMEQLQAISTSYFEKAKPKIINEEQVQASDEVESDEQEQ